MSNYIVTATGKTLNDYFQPFITGNTRAQLTNINNIDRTDINVNYLPFAVGNDTPANSTGYNYTETGTGLYKDLSDLFAMKISYTGTKYTVNALSPLNNSTFITFNSTGTPAGEITFSNEFNKSITATIVMVSGGGAGKTATSTQSSGIGNGGGGGTIVIMKLQLEANVKCYVTVPGAAAANANGGSVLFTQGSNRVTITGGKSGSNGGLANGAGSFGGSWNATNTNLTIYSGGNGGIGKGGVGRDAETFPITYNNNTSVTYNSNPNNSILNYLNCCGGGLSFAGNNNRGGLPGSYGIGATTTTSNRNGGNAVSPGSGGGGGGVDYVPFTFTYGTGGTGGPGIVHIFF